MAHLDHFGPSVGDLSTDAIVLAALGASWLDELSYTADLDDDAIVTARPVAPAPIGDTLGTVVSPRASGPQTVCVTAEHAAIDAAVLLAVR